MTLFGKLIAGLLIIGGAGGAAYYFTSQSEVEVGQNEMPIVENEVPIATTSTEGKKMAFSKFMQTDRGSYTCEVNQNYNGATTKGTVYLDNGMMRADFATSVAGQNLTSSVVLKDGYSYTWTSMSPTGFKVRVPTEEEVAGSNATATSDGRNGTIGFNTDQIGDYNCITASVDASRFTLPATVTFTEIKR